MADQYEEPSLNKANDVGPCFISRLTISKDKRKPAHTNLHTMTLLRYKHTSLPRPGSTTADSPPAEALDNVVARMAFWGGVVPESGRKWMGVDLGAPLVNPP